MLFRRIAIQLSVLHSRFVKQIVGWGKAHIVVIVKVLLEVNFFVVPIQHLDIQAQRLQFLD